MARSMSMLSASSEESPEATHTRANRSAISAVMRRSVSSNRTSAGRYPARTSTACFIRSNTSPFSFLRESCAPLLGPPGAVRTRDPSSLPVTLLLGHPLDARLDPGEDRLHRAERQHGARFAQDHDHLVDDG